MNESIREIHKLSGLLLGLILTVVGLSGSGLVFRADIERLLTRDWLQASKVGEILPLDVVVAAGAAAIPEKEVVRVVLPRHAGETVEVLLQKRRPLNLADAELVSVFVDPYRGTVVGQRPRSEGWLWLVQDFHYALFSGEPGLKANGIGAVFLLILAVSGPFLWWPGWSRRSSAFRIRRGPAPARWRDIHAVIGVGFCLILAVISLTGMYYAYRSTTTAVITLATGGGGMRPPTATSNSSLAPGNAPMKVIVTVQRKSDQRIAITEFEVFPTSFKAAEYPPEIRPGQRVLINPNFTSVPGMEAVTTIVDEFGQILKQIPGGAPFYFDLQNTRNTKFVFLERKINGKIFGDRYRIDIKSSVPEAGRELPKSIGTVVYVKSCGVYDGTKNRCRIVNKEGTSDNIKRPQELYADSEDDNAGCFVQRFQIVPKDPDKPYSVTVFFIDSQGNKSNEVEISYP